jgi:hypothetical protein
VSGPLFIEPDQQIHGLRYRRYASHATAVWCPCGWKIPTPRRIVFKRDIEAVWRSHLDTPERGDLTEDRPETYT